MFIVVKISVILPTYDGEEFLCEAIESVLNQTFKDFELIIVFQPSGDRSQEILEEFNDPRIHIVMTEPGIPRCYNIGLDHAKGEYIAILDDDDIYVPTKLEVQNRFLDENNDYIAVTSSTIIINEDGLPTSNITRTLKQGEQSGFNFLFIHDYYFPHPSIMFRRTDIRYDERFTISAEIKFCLQLFYKKKVFHNNEPLVLTRRSGRSVMKEHSLEERFRSNLSIKKEVKDELDISLMKYLKSISNDYFHICGEYFENHHYLRSLKLLCISLLINPLNLRVYVGILKRVAGIEKASPMTIRYYDT